MKTIFGFCSAALAGATAQSIAAAATRHLLRPEFERMKQVLAPALGAVLGAAASAAAHLVAKIRRTNRALLVGLRRSFATGPTMVLNFRFTILYPIRDSPDEHSCLIKAP